MLRNALRPAKPSDFHHLDNGTRRDASRAVWLAGRKEPLWAHEERNGLVKLYEDHQLQSLHRANVPLTQLQVGDRGHQGGLNSTPGPDVDTLVHRSAEHSVATMPGQPGHYVLRGRSPQTRALVLLQGTSAEPHYAFGKRTHFDITNPIDMRGRGPKPSAQDVAVVAVHGLPTGFHGIETDVVARVLAQEITKINRRMPGRIRTMQLMPCFQGDRQFHLAGSTPAERFQAQLDQAFRTLREKPRVLVLASERPGPLASSNTRPLEVQRIRYGRQLPTSAPAAQLHYEAPKFVPAGTQDTLAHRGDRAEIEALFTRVYQSADAQWRGNATAAIQLAARGKAPKLAGAVVVRRSELLVVIETALSTALLQGDNVLGWLFTNQDNLQ